MMMTKFAKLIKDFSNIENVKQFLTVIGLWTLLLTVTYVFIQIFNQIATCF